MIHHKRWQTYNIIRLWNVTCGSWFHQLSRPSLICITVNDNDPVFKMCIFTGLVGSVFQITASSGGCDLTLNCRLIFDGLVAVCRAELFLQNLEIKKSPPQKNPRWASKTDQCIYPKLSCWGTSGTYYCTHSLHYPLAKFPLWEWPFFFISNRRLFCIIRHANGSKLDAHIHQPNALHLFICKYTVLTQGLQQK